jgi:hypothetical protein
VVEDYSLSLPSPAASGITLHILNPVYNERTPENLPSKLSENPDWPRTEAKVNPGAVLDGVSFTNPLDPAFDLATLG